MDLIGALVQHVHKTRYEDLPARTVAMTKMDIADTLGCALAATSAPGCKELTELMLEMGGKAESTLWGGGGQRLPASNAALLNGTYAHAHDMDDAHERAVLHAGCEIIPAVVAVGETLGASGKDVLTAIAVGIDVIARLGMGFKEKPADSGWILSAIAGYIASAAATAKLLGLDDQGIRNSMGIAYAQSSGNMQAVVDGALTKRLQSGLAARGGALSAQLAKKGFTGARDPLEGKWGLYRVYGRNAYTEALVTDGLGRQFEVEGLTFKLYPSGRPSHASVEGALALRKEAQLAHEHIASVDLLVTAFAFSTMCDPIAQKQRPASVVDAQMSIPFCVATALVKGKVGIAEFTAESVSDPRVRALAEKIRAKENPTWARGAPRAEILIKLTDGRTLSKMVEDIRGSATKPITMDELLEKFQTNVNSSAWGNFSVVGKELTDMLRNLEDLSDIRTLTRLLV